MPAHDDPKGLPPTAPPKPSPTAWGLGTDGIDGSLGTEGAMSAKRDWGRLFEAWIGE